VVESVVRLGESWPRDGALLERFAGRLCAKGKRARYQRERRDYGSRTLRPTPKRQQALLTNDRLDISTYRVRESKMAFSNLKHQPHLHNAG
jgi:hypothetical protein